MWEATKGIRNDKDFLLSHTPFSHPFLTPLSLCFLRVEGLELTTTHKQATLPNPYGPSIQSLQDGYHHSHPKLVV